MSTQSEVVVGIDLGTTYSVVAHLAPHGKPTTILNDEGERTTPSVVYFDDAGAIVGREAVKAGELEPQRVAQFAKRDMGEVVYQKKILGQAFPPEAIQALVLGKLKRDAELQLGSFTKAVVTVPAYFNEPRRRATQDAGRLAGLEVIDIINEPTAAALAYGLEHGFVTPEGEAPNRELVMVYDLGGGTFDATLMEIQGSNFRAVATAGDVYLGGIDWDGRIAEHFAKQLQQEHGVDPRNDPAAKELLLHAAAEAKHTLSARQQAATPFACAGQQARLTITRDEFEDLTADLLDRTRLTVNKVLKEALADWSEVTRLILVGGSTRMPVVRAMLERESGLKVDRSLSPDEAVAHGAAIYAAVLAKSGAVPKLGISVQNVNSHDLGVLGVHPETGQPQRHIMIPRNTQLPASRASQFQTSKDNQKNVAVRVVEGGTDTGEGSTPIGKCVVHDLPHHLPAGSQVVVTFQYESDGTLSVHAALPSVHREASTVIERATGLTEEEVLQWKAFLDEGAAVAEDDATPLDDLDAISDLNVENLIDFDDPAPTRPMQPVSQSENSPAAIRQSTPSPSTSPSPAPLTSGGSPSPEKTENTPESDSSHPDDDALDDFLKGFG